MKNLVTIIDEPNNINVDVGDVVTVVEKDHSKLNNLDYENSGHTGFASKKDLEEFMNSVKGNSFTYDTLGELGDAFGINISVVEDSYSVTKSTINYRGETVELHNGDVFYIVTQDVPDYWFSLDNMKLYKLETKIDASGGIETLVGTEEKPILFRDSMQTGKLYLVSGKARYSYGILFNISVPTLGICINPGSESSAAAFTFFNARINGQYWSTASMQQSLIYVNKDNNVIRTETDVPFKSLNGSITSHGAIYAPTASGTAGQILQSSGHMEEPTWIDMPSGGIETLVGTSDKYINFYNDMEAGKYYIISGYIYSIAGNTDYISLPVLAYRYSDDKIRLFNSSIIANQYGSYKWKSSPKQDTLVAIYSSGINGLIGNINLINTLNGSNENEPIDIYAPTTGGTAGQILQSSGSGAPTWTDMPSGGIEELVGTEEKPINLATDMEVNKLYLIKGYIVKSATTTRKLDNNVQYYFLCHKSSDYGVEIFNNGGQNKPTPGSVLQINFDIDTGYESSTQQSNGVKVNSISTSTPIQIYVPRTKGSDGQIVVSKGNTEPEWANPSDLGIATTADVEAAIGNVSSLLGDTSDLEV